MTARGNVPGHVPVQVTINRRDPSGRLLIGTYVGCSGCLCRDDTGTICKRPWDEAVDADHQPIPGM